jgi:hypothetical protein
MTTKAATKPIKVVHILGRAQFKANGYILYRVQAEVNGVRHETHDVTVIDGKVTSCTDCKAWQFKHECCHTTEVQKREDERVEMEHCIDQDLEQHVEDDLRFNPWHGSNRDYSERLSREEYCDEFNLY